MNFERNGNIKDILNIGWKKTIPHLNEKYYALRSELQKYRNLGLPEHQKAIDEIWKARPRRFVAECGWANIDQIFEKMEEDEYYKVYDVILKWHKTILE